MLGSFNLDKTYQYLLIALAFLLPLTVFGGNLIIVIIVILWLISGNYKSKFNQIINTKLLLASIVFFCLHVIGLLWTEDLEWGFHIVHKMWYFLLLYPILYNIVKRKDITAWPEKEKSSNHRLIMWISWLLCLSVFVFFILLLLPNDIFVFRNMGSIFYWIGIIGLVSLYFLRKNNPDMTDDEWKESKWVVLVWVVIFIFLIIFGLTNA